MANVIAQEGAPDHIAVINLEPGHVLTETMEETFRQQNASGAHSGALPATVPAAAITYLCTCDDPMTYSGTIVGAPELVRRLELHK